MGSRRQHQQYDLFSVLNRVWPFRENGFDEHGASTMNHLGVLRRAFAKRLLAQIQLRHDRLEQAFATVPREHYLGPGPWPIVRQGRYVLSPDDDPLYIYDNVAVGLDTSLKIDNGQPADHARWIADLDPPVGGHAVH